MAQNILLSALHEVSFDIQGVVAPVFTPVDDHDEVDLSIIPGYLQYLTSHGVHAILVGGTTGENVTLSLKERKSVLNAWMKAAKPAHTKIIAQVGGVPFPEVIEMAKYTEEKKADAIMTLPEIYYKPRNVDSLVSYLEDVSHAAPSLPLLYYHFPMMSGVNMNIPEFFSLASSRIPNFKGMKADLDAAMQVNDLLRDDQKIFIGNHMISPAVLLGHESSIATVTNMLPDLVQGIVAASKKGDVASVRDQQMRMNRIVDAITSQGEFLPSMKAAMYMMTGIRVGKPRRPMAALDEKRVCVIKDNLKNLLTTTFDF